MEQRQSAQKVRRRYEAAAVQEWLQAYRLAAGEQDASASPARCPPICVIVWVGVRLREQQAVRSTTPAGAAPSYMSRVGRDDLTITSTMPTI